MLTLQSAEVRGAPSGDVVVGEQGEGVRAVQRPHVRQVIGLRPSSPEIRGEHVSCFTSLVLVYREELKGREEGKLKEESLLSGRARLLSMPCHGPQLLPFSSAVKDPLKLSPDFCLSLLLFDYLYLLLQFRD